MPYTEHFVVKSADVSATAVGLLETEASVPNLVTTQSVDQFKGKPNDTLTFRVPGVLPARRYAFRNDRSAPIQFDVLAESTTTITFGDRIYSAVEVTDEQADFDLNKWGDFLQPQARAVAHGLNTDIISTIEGAEYNAVVGVGVNGEGVSNIRAGLRRAKVVLDKFKAPTQGRVALVGANVAEAILADDNLSLASAVSQDRAASVLADATLGRIYGFTIVQDLGIGADEAYLWGQDAFVMYTGVPSIPNSVPYGSTTSYGGFSLRHMIDYDVNYLVDRSIVDTYCGSNAIKDFLTFTKEGPTASDPKAQAITENPYQVRAIKLELGGTPVFPNANSELAKATGVTSADVTVAAPDAPAPTPAP